MYSILFTHFVCTIASFTQKQNRARENTTEKICRNRTFSHVLPNDLNSHSTIHLFLFFMHPAFYMHRY